VNRSKLNDDLSRFEDELRAWGARPPRIPAAVARRRVTTGLPLAREPFPWLRLAAAAVLLVVLAVAVWRGSPRPAGEATTHAALGAPALDPNVVVWVVDARTTVYFVLSPIGSAKGGVSCARR
jgi:hypothetical protein